MDLSSLLQLGASVIQGNSDQSTTGLPAEQISSALGNIFGGKSGNPDFAALLSNLQNSGLGEIATSWLGKGENLPISADAISGIIDIKQIEQFAGNLGISLDSAKKAIADALPEMIDKASPEGSLLDTLADNLGGSGLGGIFDAAKKLL